MIVEFGIQNFGSVKEKQILSFEATKSTDLEQHYVFETTTGIRLLKMALIYGANASGKTTILKALEFLRILIVDPAEKKTDELNFKPFLFDIHTPEQNSILSISFIQNDVRYAYEVEFNKKAIVREELDFYQPNKANIYKRTTDLEKQFTNISFGSKIRTDKTFDKVLTANTLWNTTVLGGFLKTNLENNELKEVQAWFTDYLKKIILPHSDLDAFVTSRIKDGEIRKDEVIQILRKADFRISDILVEEEEQDLPDGLLEFLEKQVKAPKEQVQKLRDKGKVTTIDLGFEHNVGEGRYVLPIGAESQGTQRYYGLAGILTIMIKNKVAFCIDELESSLHPDLFVHFILTYLLNVKKSQLLCTTHNREILNNRDIFRNDVIWFANKNDNCATTLYSLADFDSKVIRDTSNVHNAYKIGKLGGVPNLGDYYIDTADESN